MKSVNEWIVIQINKQLKNNEFMLGQQNILDLGIELQASLDGQNSLDHFFPNDHSISTKQKQMQKPVFLNQTADDTMLLPEKEGQKKSMQNKLKYKKLKQKINSLCEQIQDQGFLKDQKDLTSPNKSRLVKLALELQKSLRTQAIDYQVVESLLKEIQKLIENKRQHDILILRGVRMMSTLFTIVKRFPLLHKHEATQSMPALEMSLKLLRIMLTLGCNREYLLISNQMIVLSSMLNCSLMREQKRITTSCLYILNLLMGGPNRIQLHPLLSANIQYILCSSLIKRLKTYLQTCLQQDDPSYSQLMLLGFRFYYFIMCISCKKQLQRPIYDCKFSIDSLSKAISGYFQSGIELLTQGVIDLVYQKQSQSEQRYVYRQQQIANFKINILLSIFKTLNLIFHVDVVLAQKTIKCNNLFMDTVLFIFNYTKQQFQQNAQIKRLCSQIIVFIGNLAFQNYHYQEIIRTSGLLQSLCNYPIQYCMDPTLRNIIIPTFCCLIYDNANNFTKAFSDMSVQPIVQYIQKEINYQRQKKIEEEHIGEVIVSGKNIKSLSRKTSVSSINSSYSKASMAESFSTQTSNNIGVIEREIRFQHKFRPQLWQKLITDLKRIEDC